MKWIRHLAALCVMIALFSISAAQDVQTPQELCDAAAPAEPSMMQFQAAEEVLEAGVDYRAILCTSAGAIYIDLYESLTPITVNNFVFLAQQGYYNSSTFHRVIPDFMAQAGDPTATGRGGPGYQFEDEPIGFLSFDRPGLLAMANAGPGTNGSQFFITTAPTTHLNYRHTIFGDVLIGQDNVEAIRERDPQTATEEGEKLRRVLIITDPAMVDNSGVVELEPAAEAEIIAAFTAFASGLPATVSLIEDRSGYFSAAQLVEALPADFQPGFRAYAEDYSLQFRYSQQFSNGDCSPSLFFSTLGYQVDVFASSQAAAIALQDNLTRDILASQGFEHDASTASNHVKAARTCSGEDGVHILSQYTRGRFLVTIDVLVAAPILDQVPAAKLPHNLAMQIEGAFAAVYRSEIR